MDPYNVTFIYVFRAPFGIGQSTGVLFPGSDYLFLF